MRVTPLVLLACTAGTPATAFAQAVIVGLVKDQSGALLSNVAVSATSPVLIETSRTAITDGSGRYRIDDLRPGPYAVRFTLEGFRTFQREGIELTGSFTVTVDAELSVGAISETTIVTAAAPVVDVRSATSEVTLGTEIVRSLPTVRSYNALVVLVPGVVTNVNDTVTGTATTQFPVHGGRPSEGRLLVDGLNVGSPPSGNSAASYVVDIGLAQEVTFSSAGASGEFETAGLVMNIVPKAGSASLIGAFLASGTGAGLHADNLTPALREQGVMASTPLTRVYDVSGALGGPLATDRAWYFATAHKGASTIRLTNIYYNRNAGDATRWMYEPDRTRPAYSDRTFENAGARVTWQLTPRHRIGVFWDAQALCRTCTGATRGLQEPERVSPEAVGVLGRPLHVSQATWSSPITDRLLVDAGYGGTYFGVGNFERQPNPTRDLIRVAEQCASGCPANGNIPGLVYRSQDFGRAYAGSYLWKGSVSYVTVAHSLKIGYQRTFMSDDRTWMTNNQHLAYRFNNGVPNQLTQSISPWVNDARTAWEAVFAQHRWTIRRLSLQGAVRFDRAWSWFPEQTVGPSRFLPAPFVIPETTGVDAYKDLTPRMGVAYDLFGTGTSALKMTLGRFLESAGVFGNYAMTNPTLRMPQTTSVFGTAGVTRNWIDANGNFAPDCDLLNSATQDLRGSGGDVCGELSNRSFGRNVLTNNFDPKILGGWGVRPSDWSLTLSLEQQIGRRASVEVSYTRRWYRGFFVVDNQALAPSDLTPFSITAPVDPRLPGGGGYAVTGLYDVAPGKVGQVDNLVTDSETHGAWYQHFNGVDVTANIRAAGGFTFVGGTSTGRTVADNCQVRARLPELATTTAGTSPFGAGLAGSVVSPLSPYCHVAFGILTQFRGLSTYVIPRAAIQLSAALQSKPGPMLVANYAAPNAVAAASLGRNLSGMASNVTVNVVAPGTLYGERINQLDIRAAKILRLGSARTTVAVDVYNALNSSAVLTYNGAFVPGGPWLQPLTILTPRFFRLNAEFDF